MRAIVALLSLNALSVPAMAGPAAQPRVEIVLANFKFAPETIRLKAGQPVTLHFVNQGSGGHNFSAPEFFSGVAGVTGGRIELGKGESRDVLVTPRAGTYAVRCTHFLHTSFGMKGSIIVQ
jgi:plastocyanin